MLLQAAWEDVLFVHFLVDPGALQRRLPAWLQLDLPLGEAWVTLVALRSRGPAPLPSRLLGGLPRYAQINLQTYVRFQSEPGLFMLDQAVSSTAVAAAARLLRWRQRGAKVRVVRQGEHIEARLDPRRSNEEAIYRRDPRQARLTLAAQIAGPPVAASHDLLGRALLERYTIFESEPTSRTRVEHSPWLIQRAEVEALVSDCLLPDGARLAAAHYGTPRIVSLSLPESFAEAVAPSASEPSPA